MGVTAKEVTVFRFPQYSVQIDQLPSEELAKMEALAGEIAGGLVVGTAPILALLIVGHADHDAKGPDFEMQVSVDRAEGARSWLSDHAKAQVQLRGGDPSDIDLIEFSLFGYGASDLYTQSTTFPEREMNRRIVVKYASVDVGNLFPLGVPNLVRAGALIRAQPQDDKTARIICALDKLIDATVDDTYFEWGSLSQVAGGLAGLSDDQVLAIAQSIFHSLRADIDNNNNYGPIVPDDIVVANLLQWELNVRNVKEELLQRIQIDGDAAGQVHLSAARYIARSQDNPKHILSCFKKV